MNRRKFVTTSVLGVLGSHFTFNSELLNWTDYNEITIENILGLNQSHLESNSILLEKETYRAFSKMKSAASKDGISLSIVSGYRSFERQKSIWERKFSNLTQTKSPSEAISEIITYSSIPGTSRHHWGTDIDIIDSSVKSPKGDLLLEQNYIDNGVFSKLNHWMTSYAVDFGFELVYTNDENRTGFNYEPWHYTFAPKAKELLELQLNKKYRTAWDELDFNGKSEMTASFINSYFQDYALGINHNLKPS